MRRLGAKDNSIDIIGLDVILTSEFANAGWIAPWTGKQKEEASKNVFPSVLKTASFEGELYATPFNTNTQLLWYRKDLVKQPPKTWDEMIEVAEELPEAGQIQVQGERYEGYTVWVNSLIESAGTSILTSPEEIDLEQKPTEEALEVIGKLAHSSAASPELPTSNEDTRPARLRGGQGGLHDQLHLRLRQRQGKRPGNQRRDGRGAVPAGQLQPGQTAARRVQPRGQQLLQPPERGLRSGRSACPAKKAS